MENKTMTQDELMAVLEDVQDNWVEWVARMAVENEILASWVGEFSRDNPERKAIALVGVVVFAATHPREAAEG